MLDLLAETYTGKGRATWPTYEREGDVGHSSASAHRWDHARRSCRCASTASGIVQARDPQRELVHERGTGHVEPNHTEDDGQLEKTVEHCLGLRVDRST
jgi:hypothetical protein